MTAAEEIAAINAESDALDVERLALEARRKEVHARRCAAVRRRELEIWGLTEEEYAACKDVIEKPRRARLKHDGLLVRLRKTEAKSKNLKFPTADRARFAAEVAQIKDEIIASSGELVMMMQTPVPPLVQLLNAARVAKGLPPRNVNGVFAG